MILSNFNVYDKEDSMNFEGLNMLSTSFSVMFTIYNLFLANMVVFEASIRITMTVILFIILQITLLFTNFTFDGMNVKTTVSIVIAMFYICILVPTFDQISKSIQEESLYEARLSYG